MRPRSGRRRKARGEHSEPRETGTDKHQSRGAGDGRLEKENIDDRDLIKGHNGEGYRSLRGLYIHLARAPDFASLTRTLCPPSASRTC